MIETTVYQYHYNYLIRKDLIMKYNYNQINLIPTLKKIVINTGTKEALINKKKIIPSLLSIELITGSQPIVTTSKKAIANFNLKKNYPIGLKITLTKDKMYDLLLKLANANIYLNKDFIGYTLKSFNNYNNLNFGIKDFGIFLELAQLYENFEQFQGLNLSLVTSRVSLNEAITLFSGFRLPFIK